MFRQTDETQQIFIISCGVYLLYSVIVYMLTHQFVHIMMIWNLFLAALPLVFAFIYGKCLERKHVLLARLFGLLWLCFFPNSPYLITDFIHLQGITFIYDVPTVYSAVSYSTALISWMSLLQIGIAVIAGICIGMLSFAIVIREIDARWGRAIALLANLVFCLISGYSVYVGRFLRLNSWDIVNPMQLVHKLSLSINRFTVEFSLLFAFFIFMIFGLFALLLTSQRGQHRTRFNFHK
ncbi:MAG: DUF1361 domain-containing protein [Sporolactobacillus sp.]